MKIFAMESSCDDTAAAIVENGRTVIASLVSSQINEHKIYGGVVPEIASRKHIENIGILTKTLFENANLSVRDMDALAVTFAPGLIGSLLVGVNFIKGLSLATGLPIVPVHHIKAHIASLYLTNADLKPPFLCLVVSGGHSHIVEVLDYTNFEVIGKTRDDAAGEAFDKIGRRLGMDYPGGVELDKIAQNGNPESFKLPTPLKEENTYDFSFSGMKTAMMNIINNLTQKGEQLPIEDLSASFRKSVVDCLITNFIRAAYDKDYSVLAVAGGVSANSLLRKKLELECKKRNFKFFKPNLKYCGDNAAMVGSQGYYEFLNGTRADFKLNAKASQPLGK